MAVRSLNTAASGMKAMQTKVDVLSNNLANVSTTGYKRDRADFSDLIYQFMRRPGILTPLGNKTATGIQIGSGVRTTGVSKEFEQGSLMSTGNQLDIAIIGEGFFQIQIQNGQIAYTRNGAFNRDSEGNIVTAEGYKLEPAITLSQDAVRVEISPDGQITSFNDQGTQIGQQQLQLVRFSNPQGLEAIGDNLYVANPDATGTPQPGNPATPNFGTLKGRFLEASNVDVVQSMVELIKAQRAYELNANAIRSSDSMLQQAANLVR